MHTRFSLGSNFASNRPFFVFLDALNARRCHFYWAQKIIENFVLGEKLRPSSYFSTLTIEQLSQVAIFHKSVIFSQKVYFLIQMGITRLDILLTCNYVNSIPHLNKYVRSLARYSSALLPKSLAGKLLHVIYKSCTLFPAPLRLPGALFVKISLFYEISQLAKVVLWSRWENN